MSVIRSYEASDLVYTRWILRRPTGLLSRQVRVCGRWPKSMTDAPSWLSLIEAFQQGQFASMH